MAKEEEIKDKQAEQQADEQVQIATEKTTGETNAAEEQEISEDAASKEETPEDNDSKEEEKEEKDPLEEANAQIADLKDKYLRQVAEFDNYRKRTIKEKAELILNGGAKTITALLPVLDDFERLMADKTEDAKVLREGMELIFKKFNKTLEGLGVKKIDTEDKDFNVDFHEAIAMVPGMGDDKKGKVIECVQTGYMLNDKVLRHAKVAVGQ